MKLKWRRHKLIGILVFAFLIFIPVIVFGIGSSEEGYRSDAYSTNGPITPFTWAKTCIHNSSGTSYFLPTRSYAEWYYFRQNKPSVLTEVGCCGDDVCSPGIGENSSNCPQDCPVQTIQCYDYSGCPGGQNCSAYGWCNGGDQVCYSMNWYDCYFSYYSPIYGCYWYEAYSGVCY